jgi:hypothetical protein
MIRWEGLDADMCAAIAHASLAETLIRLNTGLVGIIATFLNHNGGDKEKKRPLHLDYKSLTSLSDASRRDAMDSMQKLYVRLGSQQVVQVQAQKPDEKKKSSKQRGPTVARVQLEGKDKDATQLVFMRPKNSASGGSGGRKGSTSSNSSGSKRTSPIASPLTSPLPLYTAQDPFPFPPTSTSAKAPRPTHTQQLHETAPFKLSQPPAGKYQHQVFTPKPTSPTARPVRTTPSPPIVKRRIDKATPSTYTFASDSTKLGEIPMRNWTVPWDYAQAERLNEEAEVMGMPVIVAGEKKGKRGLFGFLSSGRRGAKV